MPAARFFLIIFLILLQGIAPLVHAHAGGGVRLDNGKLHLPGLESYSQADNIPLACAGLNQPEVNGLAIGIHSGIEQNREAMPVSPEVFCLLASVKPLPKPPIFWQLSRYQQRSELIGSASWVFPQSPRAPPLA